MSFSITHHPRYDTYLRVNPGNVRLCARMYRFFRFIPPGLACGSVEVVLGACKENAVLSDVVGRRKRDGSVSGRVSVEKTRKVAERRGAKST